MIGVLGGLRVLDDLRGPPSAGEPLVLERKARELLTLLALQAPAALGVDELARALWDDPPVSATKTVRAHVSRIRTALRERGEPNALHTVGGNAYRLVADTDVQAIRRWRQQARRLLADDPDRAAGLLAQARDAWQGAPQLPATVPGLALAAGWERDHRQLVGEHLNAEVMGASPETTLGELARITAADPLDEPGWVTYVLALNRSHRQVEALDAVARARQVLAEVGLSPGPALAAAQAEVLAADGGSSGPARLSAAEPTTRYTADGVTAYVELSKGHPDLLLLNPAMVTVDGLLDEPHVRQAHSRLAELGRLVCLDRRGIGLSEPLDLTGPPLEQWVDDVGGVIAAAGLDHPVVVANFDTGLVALEHAARHPRDVAGLVLINCYATYQRRPDYPYGLEEAITRDLIEAAVDPARSEPLDTAGLVAPSLAVDAGFRAWWSRIGRRAAGPSIARTIRTVATHTDLRHRLAQVQVPVLVLHRRQCTNVDPGHSRFLAEHLPDARLCLVDGVDGVWFSRPDDLIAEIRGFVTEVSDRRRRPA